MNRRRRIHGAPGLLLACVGIGAVALAVYLPVSVDSGSARTRVASVRDNAARFGHTNRPNEEDFSSFINRSLQGPLFDPPPPVEPEPAPEPELPPPPLPEVRLLATMMETGGTSHALFSQMDGTILVRGVGDSIGEDGVAARVERITQDQVFISFDGNEFTLVLPKEPPQ
ncbi:MAG: hypothetical protein KDB27_15855 [Planctomycetales bacterium]|nr:hypothetical protein [Planctomycetales bacterium]